MLNFIKTIEISTALSQSTVGGDTLYLWREKSFYFPKNWKQHIEVMFRFNDTLNQILKKKNRRALFSF